MKEEINEILELLRDGIKRPVVTLSKYSLDNICELNPNECKKLLEYIENLQQENKKYKEVIDKAINLIVKETKSMPMNGCKIRLIELLDILKEVE